MNNIQPSSPAEEMKHSKLGIASCLISILVPLGTCLAFGISSYWAKQPQSAIHKTFMGMDLLLFVGVLLLSFVGIAIGTAGIAQPNRRKELSIIGLIMNIVLAIGLTLFFALVILVAVTKLRSPGI